MARLRPPPSLGAIGLLPGELPAGIAWAFWHVPFLLLPNSLEAAVPFLLFLLGCLAETFIYTWLFNRTRGSVLICMLFHAATNLALTIVPVFPDMQNGSLLPYVLFTLVELVVALGIILISLLRHRRTLFENVSKCFQVKHAER